MTTFDRFDPFERRISEAIDEVAAARLPVYLDDVLQQTARTPQRPRWTFPQRWIPMDTTPTRPGLVGRAPAGAGSVGGRRMTIALGLLLLALLAVSAVAVGSRLLSSSEEVRAVEGVLVEVGPIGSLSEAGKTLATNDLVRLADGRILMIGDSWPVRRQQVIWDPETLEARPVGLSLASREQPIGVLLDDGRVLILGGDITEPVIVDGGYQGQATYSTAEIFDPATGSFHAAGPMVGKGWSPSAIRLADGRVLVLDGASVDDADASDPLLPTAEIYDPATDTFTATGPMTVSRGPSPMALLPDGRVLVVHPETSAADLFDPATHAFSRTSPVPGPGPHPDGGRYWPEGVAALVPLPDGRVLAPGRRCMEVQSVMEGRYPTSSAIFDPATEAFTVASSMPHCVETALSLPDGRVYLTAFWGETTWSGIYDPTSDTVIETAAPPAGRYMDVIGLHDGRILMVADGVAWILR